MTERDVVPVLVVGAGPTGLTTALLLAGLGIASTVVDRSRGPYPLPRAVHLDDEAVRILQRVGVAGAFAAISRPAAGLRLLDARSRPFAEFRRDGSTGEHGHPGSNLFDQPELERVLRAEIARRPLVELHEGVEVVGIEQEEGVPVRVTTRRAGTGALGSLRARVVLGCDGAGSTVRDAVGARLRDLRFTQRWFVLDVRADHPLPTWGGVDQLCDPRRAATFLPLPRNRYRFEFRMRPGETAEQLARPARVAELTAGWRGEVGPAGLEVLRAAEYTFRARLADRWRRGRVLLLGDAAHLTPPFIGQGLGLGMRDAHNLAWKLAALLHERPAPAVEDALLDSYRDERAPHAEAVIRGAIRIGRAMTGGQALGAALRRPLAGLVLRVPAVRAHAQRGIVARYGAGPLVDPPRHRRDLAGTCCPQPLVHVGGRTVRLDEVLGDGYALLLAGPAPIALRARAGRVRARTVGIGAGPADVVVDGPGATALRAWLRRGRAAAALLRPDRVVAATAPVTCRGAARRTG